MIASLRLFLSVKEQRAVGFVFLAMSIGFGAWITRLPELQTELELSDGQLGTALFCFPLGAVTLLPFYSKIIYALSERRTILLSLSTFLGSILFSAYMPDRWAFMVVLYLAGLSIGLTDVAMNAVAALVEKRQNVQIMSTCHGFFSVGGMLGSFLSIAALRLKLSLQLELIGLVAVLIAVFFLINRNLLISDEKQSKSGFVLPRKEVLVLALIGLCIMMTEGGITDWSTIYLGRDMQLSGDFAGFGFAGFSLAMALGRFNGDKFIGRTSSKRLLTGGVSVGILGLVLVQLQIAWVAILGFTLTGLGLAIVVPILFGKAAKTEGIAPTQGLASVASAGYIGWLMGPVTIGYMAEYFGLANGFLFMLSLCVIALFLSRSVK